MSVVEIWPGGGWYSEILAPVLRECGKFYAARFSLKDAPDFRKEIDADYATLLEANPKAHGKVISTELEAPEFSDIASAGSADLALTFRNVHNWTKAGNDLATFKAFYTALKPGGVLGVVEHRAKLETPLADMIRSGYMTEAYVIELAEKAGFKLAAKSEINGNPKDTKDHPKGVWTLPPSLRLGDTDREKYLAIGRAIA